MSDDNTASADFARHYIGFHITQKHVVESVHALFKKIQRNLCADEKKSATSYGADFNPDFVHINIWSANIEKSNFELATDTFKDFTEVEFMCLKGVHAEFTDLKCFPSKRGRYVIALQLSAKSQEALREIQDKVIAHFKKLPTFKGIEPYDLHCTLYKAAGFSAKRFEEVAKECSADVGNLNAELTPFILTANMEIIESFPRYTEAVLQSADNKRFKSSDWIRRSLCLMNFPGGGEDECMEIIRSIARLSSYSRFSDDMIESCTWDSKFYERSRIIATFHSKKIRNDFYRYFRSYLSSINGQLVGADVIPSYDADVDVAVFKAMPQEKDSLYFYAQELCNDKLPMYCSKIESATLALYLQKMDDPIRTYYFQSRDDLEELVAILMMEQPSTRCMHLLLLCISPIVMCIGACLLIM